MSTIIEVEKLALNLSEEERAMLAASLLNSLPVFYPIEDEGVAEALRRDAEIEADHAQAISLADWNHRSKAGVADASGVSSTGRFRHLSDHGLLRRFRRTKTCGRVLHRIRNLLSKSANSRKLTIFASKTLARESRKISISFLFLIVPRPSAHSGCAPSPERPSLGLRRR